MGIEQDDIVIITFTPYDHREVDPEKQLKEFIDVNSKDLREQYEHDYIGGDFNFEELFLWGPVTVNSFMTVVMVPDGSKEGWDHSIVVGRLRRKLLEWLELEEQRGVYNYYYISHGERGSFISPYSVWMDTKYRPETD